jgi:tRNA threonylcarbamoyladenosine biosynthesis protein TsaB
VSSAGEPIPAGAPADIRAGAARDGICLAIDTATRSNVVAVGSGVPLASSRREVRPRRGSELLEQVDEVLTAAGLRIDDVTAVAVGSGPGSFTGLRVGLAAAKLLAYARHLPLVGVPSGEALRRAAVDAGAPADLAVVLPAGARDHYLVRPGQDPRMVSPGGLDEALAGAPALAVDVDAALVGEDAVRLGRAAVDGLGAALLAIAAERLSAGRLDDPAALVPVYVALPRGVRHTPEELGWSPDLQ